MTAPILELDDLSVDYGRVRVLDRLCLTVRPGEVVGRRGRRPGGWRRLREGRGGTGRAGGGEPSEGVSAGQAGAGATLTH